jgi:hypothetical protein
VNQNIKALADLIIKYLAPRLIGTNKYLAQFILKYGGQYLYDLIVSIIDRSKQKEQDKKDSEKQAEAVKEDQKKPTEETEKARRDAFKNGINK